MTELHRLSVRTVRGSRTVAAKVGPPENVAAFARSKRAVIFIHGFANSEDKAKESYTKMLASLSDVAGSQRLDAYADFFAFQWPGDHPFRLLNVPTFGARIGTAGDAGRALAALLGKARSDAQIILVAHSLGCRVALAAVAVLAADPPGDGAGINVGRVHLMAAAVPVTECRGEAAYATRAPHCRYAVYHSLRDKALMGFIVGQAPFDRPGFAVGFLGGPRPDGGEADRWDRRVDTGFGHGDYWPSPSVASDICDDIVPPLKRSLPALPRIVGARDQASIDILKRPLPKREPARR